MTITCDNNIIYENINVLKGQKNTPPQLDIYVLLYKVIQISIA